MTAIRIKIIFVFLFLIYLNARAQYAEFYTIEVPERYVMTSLLFKDILLKDAEVMKANKVKEVYIKSEGKITAKMLVNAEGYIEDYYTFNSETEAIEEHWRFGYGGGNILTSAYYRYNRERINYILSYENDRLASIHCDSSGKESQWDFAYEESKISKMTLLDLQSDKAAGVYNFIYNKKGALEKLTDEAGEGYSIKNNKNSVTIAYGNYFANTYKFEEGRIKERIFEYQTKGELKTQTYPKKIKTSEEYTYNEKGMITESTAKTSTGEEKRVYEYSFYE